MSLHTAVTALTLKSPDDALSSQDGEKTASRLNQNSFVVYHGVDLARRCDMAKPIRERLAEYALNFGCDMIVAACPAFATTQYNIGGDTRICLGRPDSRMKSTEVTHIMRYTLQFQQTASGIIEAVCTDGKKGVSPTYDEEIGFEHALKDWYGSVEAVTRSQTVSDVCILTI